MHHMILPHTSCSQKPTETVSSYHFVSWANESSPLCCVMSAKTTSHGPYGIMPRLIVSCRSLASDPQRWSKTLKLTTVPPQSGWHLPVWQLILWEWVMGISYIPELGDIRRVEKGNVFDDMYRSYCFIKFFEFALQTILQICHITYSTMTWEFWGQSLVDSNLNMWDGPEDQPCTLTRSTNTV